MFGTGKENDLFDDDDEFGTVWRRPCTLAPLRLHLESAVHCADIGHLNLRCLFLSAPHLGFRSGAREKKPRAAWGIPEDGEDGDAEVAGPSGRSGRRKARLKVSPQFAWLPDSAPL